MQGSLLASFGFRLLAILRAVQAGDPLLDATKERLRSFGFATIASNGAVPLTLLGQEILAYLESLALIPEEHAEFVEAVSGQVEHKKTPGP